MIKNKNTTIIQEKMQKLIDNIRYYDYMYFIKNTSVISDIDYDLLKQELENLEHQYPEYIQENSPTYTIGFQQSFDFKTHKHMVPMLSLRNTYILDEVIKFIEKDNLWPVILEPKIDGISLSLTYMNGILNKCLLRGNGHEGEDVIDHIIYTTIPFKIPFEKTIEIRGELYLSHKNFQLINEDKIIRKTAIFQNSRNATSGIIRNKTLQPYTHFLNFIPYSIRKNNCHMHTTQSSTLDFLKEIGFTLQTYILANNQNELENNITYFNNLDFDSDGIVIKTNSLELMEQLGQTTHHPRGAIAYKFANTHKESIIRNILWQVSRNGKITPIGEIEPIILNNATIKKITLHNKNYMEIHGIYIGTKVLIERVGATVPQIKKVLEPINHKIQLSKCPSCAGNITEDTTYFYCLNPICPEKKQEQIFYFCQNLDLKGLGNKSMEELCKYLKTPSDILDALIYKKQMNVHGWNKVCFEAETVITKIDPIKLLTALGVENLSSKSLSLILDYFQINTLKDLKEFLSLSNFVQKLDECAGKIKHIGGEKLQNFIAFLSHHKEEILKCILLIQKNNS